MTRGRWAIAGGVIILVGAMAAYLGFRLWLQSYLGSDAFRQVLNEKTSAALHVTGEFQPLGWNGSSVYSDGFAGRGVGGVRDLQAEQIRAELYPRNWLHREWELRDLNIQRLDVTVGAPVIGAAGSGSSPVACPKLTIFETNLRWDTGRVRRVKLTAENAGDAWLLTGTDGQLELTGWPQLDIESFRCRARPGGVSLTEATCRYGATGRVFANGELLPVPAVFLKFTGVSVTEFLPEDWRGRLHGDLSGEVHITSGATGTVALVNGRLEALPILNRIATFTRTEQYRQLTLQQATANFVWTTQELRVRQFVMESTGLLRIEGDFVLRDKQLNGDFQVGVAPASLRWLPGAQARVFTTERKGYFWAPMHVTGPVDNLQEDLSSRLVVAAGTEVFEGVKGTAGQLLDLLKPLVR